MSDFQFETFFHSCATSEEVKSMYRQLCKMWHPDLGEKSEHERRTRAMQELNAVYARFAAAARRHDEKERAQQSGRPEPDEAFYRDAAQVDEAIRAAIERIITLEGLEIEICGLWVWVSGRTYDHRAALSAADYHYSPNKVMWYFAGVPSRSRKKTPIEDIRARYGSVKVKIKTQDEERPPRRESTRSIA